MALIEYSGGGYCSEAFAMAFAMTLLEYDTHSQTSW